jgi:hypothetical protein
MEGYSRAACEVMQMPQSEYLVVARIDKPLTIF